jgi:predicted dehydrogenase
MQQQQLSRREALKIGGGASLAAFAGPLLVPSSVLARNGKKGPNDKIVLGFVGMGRRAKQLLPGVPEGSKEQEVEVAAIADVYLPRAESVAKKYGAEAYQDYRQLLERDDIDAIVTATNDHWRAKVCIEAAQSEKDIYGEKPMSLTIREGRLMVEAVRKHNRVFQTGSQQRSNSVNRHGCMLVRNGHIGKVTKVIASNYPSPWYGDLPEQPVPEGLDWDMWSGPVEPVPYHKDLFTPRAKPGWISFQPYSGGEVTGWGAHGLDQIQWALGMDGTGPVEIWVEGGEFDPPTYTEPESRARGERICSIPIVKYKYEDGPVVEFGKGPGGGGIFHGEKGTIRIDRGRVSSDPEEIAKEKTEDDAVQLYESKNHMQNWLDCIRSREKPICDVEIGHRSTTVCHLANIARWVGRKLKWDPVSETFPGDDEANAYLDRARRPQYDLPKTI